MNIDAISIVKITSEHGIRIGIVPVKKVTVNSLMTKMFAYSAMKIRANVALLYSVLNPETSSDSPSAKSNGVRFVSARFVMNHKINMGKINSIIQENILVFMNLMFIEWCIIKHVIKISDIETSYEIVCAILRRDPRREYLEFEDHPAINVEYTFSLDTHRKYKVPNIKMITGIWCG